MSEPVILLGGGGHARVVADALGLAGYAVQGVVDPALAAGSRWHFGLPVLGDDSCLAHYGPERVRLANGLGLMPGSAIRERLYRRFRQRGYRFVTLVHPRAVVAGDAVLEEGAQVMAGAVINSGARIGENVLVNTGALVEHGCVIAAHCHLAPGAVVCGDTCIGESSFIGAGAVIIQGQRLPARALVGAGCCYRPQKERE